jgi:hypothetical protein
MRLLETSGSQADLDQKTRGDERADCRAEWKASVFMAQVQFEDILRSALCEHEKATSPVAAYRDGTCRTFLHGTCPGDLSHANLARSCVTRIKAIAILRRT